jgi:hypothetical protein
MIFENESCSKAQMAVASVPPDGGPALNLIPVKEFSMEASGPRMDLTVLLEMYAEMSEGIESNPHEGTMMEPVLVA